MRVRTAVLRTSTRKLNAIDKSFPQSFTVVRRRRMSTGIILRRDGVVVILYWKAAKAMFKRRWDHDRHVWTGMSGWLRH